MTQLHRHLYRSLATAAVAATGSFLASVASAGTRIADFRPVGTDVLTGPLADGASARELPGAVLGRALG